MEFWVNWVQIAAFTVTERIKQINKNKKAVWFPRISSRKNNATSWKQGKCNIFLKPSRKIRHVFSKANKNIWFLYKKRFFFTGPPTGQTLLHRNHWRGKANNVERTQDTRAVCTCNIIKFAMWNYSDINNQTKSKSRIEISPKHT